jgi:putative spermidine/putrescine transport system permease protein
MMGRALDTFFVWGTRVLVAMTLAFLILPILITVLMSFDSRTFLGAFPPTSFSTQWYERFFSEQIYVNGLINSLKLAGTATAISLVLGTSAAIGLYKGTFPGRDTLLTIFLAPLVMPAVVIGFALLLTLSQMGVIQGFPKLVVAHCVITIPYVIRSVVAALTNVSKNVDEAAMSLGASHLSIVRTITLPIARTGAVVGAVLAFTISFDDVSAGVFLADPESSTLPLALVSMMRSNFDLTIAAASTFMIGVAILALILIELLVGVDRVFGSNPSEK